MIRFFLDEHGCAKNQVDGELMISHLTSEGMVQTFVPDEADLIIINSCGFIESAKKESLDALLSAKKRYPHSKILLTGCLAERYAVTFQNELPEADGVFGNGDISKITEVAAAVCRNERPVVVPLQKGVCVGDRDLLLSFRRSAYVKVTEGCNNYCSFCAIPLIRGSLRSRKAADIVAEIKSLLSRGVFEINLIGQDLAAYGTGTTDDVFGTGRFAVPDTADPEPPESALSLLLRRVSKIPGQFWIRLLYIHPDHFDRGILSVIKKDSRILHYFDIPFQSGDTAVIQRMNRKGSAELYVKLVSDIRNVLPDASIRTTFLTGFPGETAEAAERTEDFLRKIKSDWSGCFTYSREEGTKAEKMPHGVPVKTAAVRADRLAQIQSDITQKALSGRIGQEYDILVEERIAGTDGLAIGRAWFEAPEVDGSVVVRYDRDDLETDAAVQPGRIVRVKAVAVSGVDIDAVFRADSPLNTALQPSMLEYLPDVASDGTGRNRDEF
ncbi:MAG: 30S ribosomal protein S12 methylthiotransferase RimO [Treponema sp.]|nr:30S ribosomal protein S12 methylthiotransferase RimO [Treponema sp.]